jgi:glycosyltransferase involved in cell wall biosynthesis
LEDLARQTIADKLEIIVVNSGSEQNEEAIVKEFQQKCDNIVYIKTEQREGIYAAWDRAVRAARGEFITNANTDDRHRTDALEIMARTLQSNPDVALVYGDQICTDTPNGTFDDHHATEMAKRPDYSGLSANVAQVTS